MLNIHIDNIHIWKVKKTVRREETTSAIDKFLFVTYTQSCTKICMKIASETYSLFFHSFSCINVAFCVWHNMRHVNNYFFYVTTFLWQFFMCVRFPLFKDLISILINLLLILCMLCDEILKQLTPKITDVIMT